MTLRSLPRLMACEVMAVCLVAPLPDRTPGGPEAQDVTFDARSRERATFSAGWRETKLKGIIAASAGTPATPPPASRPPRPKGGIYGDLFH